MKKFLIFAGRHHHAQKLFGTYLALDAANGVESKWLISNNSINIDPATEFIFSYGRDKSSVYHLYNDTSQKVVSRIKDSYEKLKSMLFTPDVINNIPPFWFLQGLREAAEVNYLSQDLFKRYKPNGLLVLHTNNFWGRILAYNAKNQNIPVFAFQEGMIRDLDQDTMKKQTSASDYVDVLFVWTEEDKKKYEAAGAKCEIIVSGPSHLDYSLRAITQAHVMKREYREEANINHDSKIVGLALPLASHYKGNLDKDTYDICSWAYIHGYTILLRAHPFDRNLGNQIKENLKFIGNCIIVADEWDVGKFISMCDVLLGQHSTIGLEAVMLKVPFFEFSRGKNKVLESKNYANSIDVDGINSWNDFRNSDEVNRFCSEFLLRNQSNLDGYAVTRIQEAILKKTE